jgi:hypothetical protein
MCRSIDSHAISVIYAAYKKELFPRLLQNPNVSSEDKHKIRELLKTSIKHLEYTSELRCPDCDSYLYRLFYKPLRMLGQ